MQAIIPFPDISPELVSVQIAGFTLALRWYALAYIAALLIGWRIVVAMLSRPRLWPADTPPLDAEQAERLLTWIILGVLAGGRIGFALFYQPAYFLTHPLQILRVWEGGMSFHGGMLGVAAAVLLFSRAERAPVLSVADALAVAAPQGLLLGRIANFINAELWGAPSHAPWAVIFPGTAAQTCPLDWVGPCARHPSQLYEALMEGAILGAVLLWLALRRGAGRAPGRLTGVFLAGYAISRIAVEFVRVADPQFITPTNPLGHVVQWAHWGHLGGASMGQILSLPMLAAGLWLIGRSRAR